LSASAGDCEEPRLLYGHTGPVTSVAVSYDGRKVASVSDDGTIRLWPMPDLSKPPLHTLPHDKLVATLRALTNLRAVRDPASGLRLEDRDRPVPGLGEGPDVAAMIGSCLGPYEIVALIGRGGMGEVEPSCGREPFDDAQGRLRESPQAKSRAKRGIPC